MQAPHSLRPREGLELVLCLLFWVALDLGMVPGPSHPVPDPAPWGRTAAVAGDLGDTSPPACGKCHVAELAAWRTSGHASASSAKLFPHAFRSEPFPLCLRCHAPEEPDREAARALEAGHGGVTCATCHVEHGTVVSARAPSGRAPHPSRHEPGLATERCGSCHEWDYPMVAHPAQTTVSEWRDAGSRGGDCASCHMAGSAAHSMPGARDAAMLAKAVPVAARVRAGSGGERVIEVTLGPVVSGHGVPTGDSTRALEIAWEQRDDEGELVASGLWSLGRRFASRQEPDGRRRVDVVDDRLSDGEVRVLASPLDARFPGGSVVVRVGLVTVPAPVRRLPGYRGDPGRTFFFEGVRSFHAAF